MNGNVSFDSNSLQTYDPTTNVGIVVNTIEHTDIPEKELNLFQIANANLSALSSVNYPLKRIVISGVIKGSTQQNLDSRIDTFKGYFFGKNKNLDINYNGVNRRYIATVNTLSVNRRGSVLFAGFQIEFVCTNPFGSDTTPTILIDDGTLGIDGSGRTSSDYSDSLTFGGTAPKQCPLITITINSVTGGTNASISIGNNDTGQTITVTRTWVATDELEIDPANETVKVNGEEVDFSGAFPRFEPGSGTLNYSDGFTTRNFDENVEYNKLYS